jgi:hypothetical protein
MAELTPKYLDLDFNTLKTKIVEQLSEDLTFNNYNYAGSNITILIELMAYLGELSTYYLNKIAKNVYLDSASIYENVSRLAQLVGYYPQGYRSSEATLKLTIKDNVQENSTIRIYSWSPCWTTPPTEEDAYISGTDTIYFAVPSNVILTYPTDFTYNDDTGYYDYSGIDVKQGVIKTYSYYGSDLVDNTLYLPFVNFDHDINSGDSVPSVEVSINDEIWTRINDFYESVTDLEENDKVYVFRYNKYEKYTIEFSDARTVPATTDRIEITLLESLGADGNVGAEWITQSANDFITVTTSAGVPYYLQTADYAITNESGAINGADPEEIPDIKENARNMANAQYRCVTKNDYIGYLLQHTSVSDANVWGEQEQNPLTNGDVKNYNKVYISIVPIEPWTDKLEYTLDSNNVKIASAYNTAFLTDISEYLEPRKMLSAYEEYVLPDFTYFKFTFSMKLKTNYRFIEVSTDLRDKLEYYFVPENRNFGEKLSFNDMISFLLDTTEKSSSNSFSKVAGIANLNIRDLAVYNTITKTWINPYESTSELYPRYISYDTSFWGENTMKVVQLGFNQFPILVKADCEILEETY